MSAAAVSTNGVTRVQQTTSFVLDTDNPYLAVSQIPQGGSLMKELASSDGTSVKVRLK